MGMNKLHIEKRRLILNMLSGGSSMRSISRIADVSINAVSKLLADVGNAALVMHLGVGAPHSPAFRRAKSQSLERDTRLPSGVISVWPSLQL